MRVIWADFNHETEEGKYPLTTIGSLESLKPFEGALRAGERVLLSDGDVEVEAVLERCPAPAGADRKDVWLAVPNRGTWRDARPETVESLQQRARG
jgi:hypothetical protein